MIDWSKPYECQWRFMTVDERTWASKESIKNVTSASYTSDSATDAVETATLQMTVPYSEAQFSGWLRIEGIATQGTSSQAVMVATMRFEPETCDWSGGMRVDSLRGVSSIFPASEAEKLADGAWAAKGSDGAARVAQLIGSCTPAPVVSEGSISLPDTVVFDLDSTPLSATKAILDAAGWVMQPDGMGEVHVMALPDRPTVSFGGSDRGMFLQGASMSADGKITYSRSWGPGLRVYDVFTAHLPEIGLDGTYRVASQRISFGSGITVEETVEEVS